MKKVFFDSHSRLRSGYQLVLAVILLFATTLIANLACLPVLYLTIDSPRVSYAGSAPVAITYAVVCIACTLILSRLAFRFAYRNQEFPDLDCFTFKKETFFHLFAGLGLGTVSFSVVVLPLYLTGQYRIQLAEVQMIPLITNFIYFFSVGVYEEIMTRGLMQHALLRFGKWPALFIVSIVFGMMHLANPNVTVNSMIGLVLAGIFMGIAMYATNSISLAIGIHIAWNWIQGPFYGIPVSGLDMGNSVFNTTIAGTNSLITGGEFGAEASLSCIVILIIFSFLLFLYGKKKNNLSAYVK